MLVFDCLTMFRLLPMSLKFYRITCLVRRCKSRVLREVLQRNGIDMVLSRSSRIRHSQVNRTFDHEQVN